MPALNIDPEKRKELSIDMASTHTIVIGRSGISFYRSEGGEMKVRIGKEEYTMSRGQVSFFKEWMNEKR